MNVLDLRLLGLSAELTAALVELAYKNHQIAEGFVSSAKADCICGHACLKPELQDACKALRVLVELNHQVKVGIESIVARRDLLTGG